MARSFGFSGILLRRLTEFYWVACLAKMGVFGSFLAALAKISGGNSVWSVLSWEGGWWAVKNWTGVQSLPPHICVIYDMAGVHRGSHNGAF